MAQKSRMKQPLLEPGQSLLCILVNAVYTHTPYIKQNSFHIGKGHITFNAEPIGSIEIVVVRSSDNKFISINVDPSDTIRNIKTEIAKKNKITIDQQILFFDDKQLIDSKTVSYYNITTQSVLKLTVNEDEQKYVVILARQYMYTYVLKCYF